MGTPGSAISIRREALQLAMGARKRTDTPEQIVEAAKIYEAFLQGEGA